MTTPPPNILFILVDDLGTGDLSANGGPGVRTPHIDSLAADGIRFNQCYANSTVCSPSRAALLTGRYPDRVGVPGVIRQKQEDSWGYFDPRAVTLPDMLRTAGYETLLVGKWHLGLEDENHPCERGFDEFHGFIDDMMDDYWTHRRFGKNGMRHNREVIDPAGHATDLFTDWAAERIRHRSGAERPFFLYLAYNAPHTPIQPPEAWIAKVKAREPGLDSRRTAYNALVEHLDDAVGRVLAALQASGQAGNTIVVFTSDNGGRLQAGACNAPFRGGKADMYEGGIRVPCFVRWPGHIQAGTASDEVVMLMDFFATFCEVADVAVRHEIEGQSILPLLHDADARLPDRTCYWVRREGGPRYLGNAYHAIRQGTLKLLHNDAFAPLELYDVARDPCEAQDLAGSRPADLKALGAHMQEHIRRGGATPWQKGKPT
ncbi:MAG: sulfatase-like hydrolase/transferase [Rhodospirillales bacterium]|jgi:arylsulfatase A-like enzyme|nr:sulfatase-like hydrolase/transferase [Rhodospirillales bacterium]